MALIPSLFSLSKFLLLTVLMTWLSYSCLFALYLSFTKHLPRFHKGVAAATIFFPTIAIYGSGILKDTICMSSVALLFFASDNILTKQGNKWQYVVYVILSIFLLLQVKPYILIAFIVPYVLFFIFKIAGKIKNPIIKSCYLVFVLVLCAVLIFLSGTYINETLGEYALDSINENINNLQNSYGNMGENAGSNFEIGEFDPSFWGILKNFPLGIITTLYRPFLWEANNLLMIFSSLESSFLFLFSIYGVVKIGPQKAIQYCLGNSLVFLCIFFSVFFAGMVGLSALNFGALARYRIPAIPFYLTGILLMLNLNTTIN